MEKVLQLMIALSGLCVISSHVQRQYFFIYEPKTFSEALSYCREKHTDLVSVQNQEEIRILNNMVDLSQMISAENKLQAWIGLSYDANSWRWSFTDPSFYKPGETEFRRWGGGEPNGGTYSHCTNLYWTRTWSDDFCHLQYASVCYDISGPNVTYVFVPTLMTWPQAQSYCREKHTDLASIRNQAEQKTIENTVLPGKVWIGLTRDLWKWSDGSQTEFRNWRLKQPNDNTKRCGAIDFGNSGQWEKSNCETKRASICYSAVSGSRQMIKVRLRSNSSLDLNDPAVMEDVLKQLKKKLKDQGLNEDVKLSWRKQADGEVFNREEEEKKKEEGCLIKDLS